MALVCLLFFLSLGSLSASCSLSHVALVCPVSSQESASRVVRQYHYIGWPHVGSPESGGGLVDLIGQVQRWQQTSGNTTIVVHCR